MTSNPMQRKSRNSFLLGVVITLLITGVIIAFLFMMLKQKSEELANEQQSKRMVYTLNQNVKAGQILTEDMFSLKSISLNAIPSDATSTPEVIRAWFLQTKEGEAVYTDKYGLYLNRNGGDKKADTIIEVRTNDGNEMQDSKGNKIAQGDYYRDINGTIEKISTSTSGIYTDEYGMFMVDTQGIDIVTRVYQENLTDEFYTYKIDSTAMNSSGSKTRIKEYIEIKNVPILARVDMNANTVMTTKLFVQSTEIITDDVRQEQYNMITLPLDLMTNDYIDIRLKLPSGQNFIVIAKKQVEIPMNADGTYISDTIKVNLREDEILTISSAIVETYGIPGSELYVTKYIDPAMQETALPTYTPNAAVTAQMQTNPNIVEIARKELAQRYSEASKALRNEYLQKLIDSQDPQEYIESIQQNVDKNLEKSLQERQKYLETLNY